MDELIERLRKRNASWQEDCDRWIADARKAGHEVSEEQERSLRHNLCGEAAAALTTMQDREATLIRALRSALDILRENSTGSVGEIERLEALGTSGLVEP